MLAQPGVFTPVEWAPVINQCRACRERRTHLHRLSMPEPTWLCGQCIWDLIPKPPLLTSDIVDVLIEELPAAIIPVPGLDILPPAARRLLNSYLPARHVANIVSARRRIPWTRNYYSMRRWNYQPAAVAAIQLQRYQA